MRAMEKNTGECALNSKRAEEPRSTEDRNTEEDMVRKDEPKVRLL